MATSRSKGPRSLTTRPPMRTSPEVASSRPAMMLSVVVLPQPDGPSSVTNSPSSMRRSTSLQASTAPKDLQTLTSSTSAISP